MELRELTKEEFKSFVDLYKPSSMYQTPYYAYTMQQEENESVFLGLIDDNVLKAASLVLIEKINGFKYASAPRGFLINYDDFNLLEIFTTEIKKYLKKKRVVAIKINPMIIKSIYNQDGKIIKQNTPYELLFEKLERLGYYHLGYNNYFEALKPRYEAVVNLDLPNTSIFANIEKTFRNKIRKSIKDGIKVYHGDINNLEYLYLHTKEKYPRDLEYFKDLYKNFETDNLIDFYYCRLDTTEYLKITQNLYSKYEQLAASLNNELIENGGNNALMNQKINVDNEFEKLKAQLVIATKYLRDYPDGIILSSALVTKWQDEVYLVMDGFDETYKNFNGKHLLLWKLMGRYSKLGYKKFNLGGVVNPNIKNAPEKYKGLNEFKLKFNSKIIEYTGDFELITNKFLYFFYRRSVDIKHTVKK